MRQMIYHRRVQKDLSAALAFYDAEGGRRLADRFFAEAESAVKKAAEHPERFHFVDDGLRRVTLDSFPFHFLYDLNPHRIRFLVLRHDKRHPRFGLGRR